MVRIRRGNSRFIGILISGMAFFSPMIAAQAKEMPLAFNSKTYTVGKVPVGIAVGDFNGDGKIDIVTANEDDHSISVLRSNGDGTFQAPQTFSVGANPVGIAMGDLTGSGNLDIVTANYNDNTVSVLLNKNDSSSQQQSPT